MTHSSSLAKAGRPKDPAKREAIAAAAMQLFAQFPYDSVTMEMVAIKAGVSKMTVYSHFTDKETMFETVVSTISDEMMAEPPAADQANMPLHERLTAIGIAFLKVVLAPHVRTMSLKLTLQLQDNQALSQRFYNAGPGRTRASLAAIIADACEQGTLETDSPIWAADDLLSLWAGGLHAQWAFGLVETTMAEEIERRSRRGTATFLRAYAAAGRRLR